MRNTLYVNLYGGPGTGKTTMMASIFAALKWDNVMSEMVPEVAKRYVWSNELWKLENQRDLFRETLKELRRAQGQVDVIVTDSPLLNQILYDQRNDKALHDMVSSIHEQMNTLDILLVRKKEFRKEGRLQSESEARILDSRIKQIFAQYFKKPIFIVDGTRENVDFIVEKIKKEYENRAKDQIASNSSR